MNKINAKIISADLFRMIKDENVYLKTEIKEEKDKLENIIITVKRELEEVKEDNRQLLNKINYYEQLNENFTI
jgi:hypothetical protein